MLRTWPRIAILNNYSPKWYREGKWHDSQQGFIHFHPIYYLKGDRARGNSIYPTKFIKWVPKPGPTQFYCTYKHRHQMVSTKSSLWRQSVKIADKYTYHLYKRLPRTFLSVFLSTEHSRFDYRNIFTCTSAVIGYPLRRYILTRLELAEEKYASVRT